MVSRSNENAHITTNFFDLEERSLKKSKGRNLSYCPKPNLKISGMDGLMVRLQKERVSREASNLIVKSRRSSSNSNYVLSWGKWDGWCAERKIDPFCSSINQILEFLSQLFQNGFQYRTINNYSSAISAFHDHIQESQWGITPEFVHWLLVFLIVDLHIQGTILFGMFRQRLILLDLNWDKMRIFRINI